MDDQGQPPPSNRRALLRLLAGTGLAAGVAGLSGCRRAADEAPLTRIPLSRVPVGERVRILVGDDPVELLRRDGEVRARSLLCTHFGCEVRWSADQGRYLCPCHGGRFDAEGEPVSGPPARPLPTLPARIAEDAVVIEAPTDRESR